MLRLSLSLPALRPRVPPPIVDAAGVLTEKAGDPLTSANNSNLTRKDA